MARSPPQHVLKQVLQQMLNHLLKRMVQHLVKHLLNQLLNPDQIRYRSDQIHRQRQRQIRAPLRGARGVLPVQSTHQCGTCLIRKGD